MDRQSDEQTDIWMDMLIKLHKGISMPSSGRRCCNQRNFIISNKQLLVIAIKWSLYFPIFVSAVHKLLPATDKELGVFQFKGFD